MENPVLPRNIIDAIDFFIYIAVHLKLESLGKVANPQISPIHSSLLHLVPIEVALGDL